MSDDVHKIVIQTARPRGTFAGRVMEGYYCVADNYVVLCDESGKPTGDGKRTLNPGGDARLIACALLRSSRRYGNSRPQGFNDRILYQKLKY